MRNTTDGNKWQGVYYFGNGQDAVRLGFFRNAELADREADRIRRENNGTPEKWRGWRVNGPFRA